MSNPSPRTAQALVGVPDTTPDLLYASAFPCPDPAAWFRLGSRTHLLVNDLEVERARRVARVSSVSPFSRYYSRSSPSRPPARDFYQALAQALSSRKVEVADVPREFPVAGMSALKTFGIRVQVLPGPFFPQRARKTPSEVRKIQAALRAAEKGMAAGIRILGSSRIGRDGFLYQGRVRLTAAALRGEMDRTMFEAGAVPAHTIAAGGVQAADPHARGSGPLRAHRPIVLDLFPRSQSNFYFADITRTVVRGRADKWAKAAFLAVATAQELAIELIASGVTASTVHTQVRSFFDRAGFPTRDKGKVREGFFHGTGHGVGLELHEPPSLSLTGDVLQPGNVLTVEPGLYYRGQGGIRLEDMVLVTRGGCRNLTRFPVFLEIP